MTKMIEVPEEHLLALKAWHDGTSISDLIDLTVALIACLPKQIEVGSRVRALLCEGIVLAIDGDTAWLRLDGGGRLTWRIASLEVVE